MSSSRTYTIVDTNQTSHYDNADVMNTPTEGSAFYGQDAQYQGVQASYQDNGDGTVSDLNTGLMWQSTSTENQTFSNAVAGAEGATTAGYDDWRLPTLKELYSLMDFSGYSGRTGHDSEPYLETDYFDFSYGDPDAGVRLIDAQYWSATEYEATTMGGNSSTFGVNFADGRIKSYPNGNNHSPDKENDVRYVRGNDDYGENDFVSNSDGTVTDNATGLMWQQADSGEAMSWEAALAWAENLEYGGYDDWRLPNAKELQSLVDYERSPDTTDSAAIDPLFSVTNIGTDGAAEYSYYWTGTTHVEAETGDYAVYLSFGRALGWIERDGSYSLEDVHGAGAQRSDPKTGDAADYPYGHGPQGDVLRIDNMVRAVRDADEQPVDGVEEQPGSESADKPEDAVDASDDRTEGDDHWIAGSGNEFFDGGAGRDTVDFGPGRSDFTIRVNNDLVEVEREQSLDTLKGVERLHFGEEGVAFDIDGIAGKAYRLYQAAFDREPDMEGLGFWIDSMDKGADLSNVSQSFLGSAEFQQKYGELDDRGFVNAMYQNVLNRDPDDAGYAFWTGELEQGISSRAGVLTGFSESQENQQGTADQITNGISFDIWS